MELVTGKRIVSKGAYVVARSKKISLHSLGWVFKTTALMLTGFLFTMLRINYPALTWMEGCAVFLLTVLLSLVVGGIGKTIIRAATRIDPGVPLTRANTADLPAPETLVRASEEPAQAQEGVLLRAVAQGQETASEQLVRASMRQE